MRSILFFGLPVVFSLCSSLADGQAVPSGASTSSPAPAPAVQQALNFRLIDQTGKSHELYRAAESSAVVLYTYGVGCPIVRQSVPLLERLRTDFEPRGVTFYLLYAGQVDTRAEVAADAQEYGITTPILMDDAQVVTRSLGVKRTAEAIVLDPKDHWKIIYRGAIDDRFDYGAQKENAEHEWLKAALTAHLEGAPVPEHHTETKGCLISFTQFPALSYAQDIAPILEAKCVSCHVDGGIGPFAMSSHKKVKGWASMIQETVLTKRMPPWHADPEYGHFENDRSLRPEETAKLLAWVAQGAPKEETEADPLTTLKPSGGQEWAMGTPDLVLQIPEEQTLPAEGTFAYRYFHVPTGLTEDKWVRGIEVMPTNSAVLHHALVFVIYPDAYEHIQPEVRGGLNGYFAAFLPGQKIKPFPAGTGQFLPAGSLLVFQMHYNATGKEEKDQTRIALYFHQEKPARALMVQAAHETEFEIPPNAADYPTTASWRAPQEIEVYGFSPHMHYRGSRFTFSASAPDGARQVLLNVPWYEFDWQPMYMLETPVTLAADTVIQCDGAFDNSKWNPRNPNPGETVGFGEQSWEEMFIGYITCSIPRDDALFSPRDVKQYPPITAETLPGTEWRAGRRFNLLFNADNTLSAQGNLVGKWRIEGDKLLVDVFGRKIEALIYGDDIYMEGRPLRRVDPEEDKQREERREQRRLERGNQSPEGQPQAAPGSPAKTS